MIRNFITNNAATLSASELQGQYYQTTATDYDQQHLLQGDPEHNLALHFLSSVIEQFSIESVLDIGAGTGRAIKFLKDRHPRLHIIGIEPVESLRKIGHSKGITQSELIDGNGNHLHFPDGSFDLVCEFAVLHHVPQPSKVVSEMLRVSNRFVFISDCNNFGQGCVSARALKLALRWTKLWKCYNYIRTKGKGYHLSEGDGLFYSYSVFDSVRQLKSQCRKLYFLGTSGSGANLLLTAAHVAVLGSKDDQRSSSEQEDRTLSSEIK